MGTGAVGREELMENNSPWRRKGRKEKQKIITRRGTLNVPLVWKVNVIEQGLLKHKPYVGPICKIGPKRFGPGFKPGPA